MLQKKVKNTDKNILTEERYDANTMLAEILFSASKVTLHQRYCKIVSMQLKK